MTGRIVMYSSAAVLASLLIGGTARGGSERTNIRGIAMARTFVAGSLGLDAVGINPANLGYPDSGTVTLSLMPFEVHIGSDLMTYGVYRDYFTGVSSDSGRVGRYLADADKQRILAGFPEDIGRVAGDVQIRPIGLSLNVGPVGRFAFTVTEQVAFFGDIPRAYAEFILYGNTPGSAFDFSSTSVKAQWSREYALSFGRPIPSPTFMKSMTAGIAIKYVQGFGYYEFEQVNTSLVTGNDGVLQGRIGMMARGSEIDMLNDPAQQSYTPFPAPAGTGWGFDIGIGGEITDGLRFGLSVTDIGSIQWTEHLRASRSDTTIVVDNPLAADQRTAVENAIRGTSVPAESFTTPLPTRLRLGLSIDMGKLPFFRRFVFGHLSVAADYNQGFQNVPGSTTRGRFSMGLEYIPLSFLPLRTGFSLGGEDRTNVAFGFGLRFGLLDLDFASENLGWLFTSDEFSYASVAMGLKFKF